MAQPHSELSMLFERALEVPPGRRAEFVEGGWGGDGVLKRELVSLLEAYDSSSGYFEALGKQLGVAPLSAALDPSASPIELAAYRVERELGGGGMSRVFLAEEIAI